MIARCAGLRWWVLVLAAVAGARMVRRADAQPLVVAAPSLNADDAVEAYIERLGMSRLLAENLATRLKTAVKDERATIAERLGKMYVALLAGAATPEERRRWEQRGRDLLKEVPEADTWDLRLNLNKAVYTRAEEVAERGRLRLAEASELVEAERSLRELEAQFTDIAVKANRRTDQLERVESAGDATDQLSNELSEARRTRSLAFYFAGWSHYYVGLLARSEPEAVEALKCFGWLLNSPHGRAASPDKMPASLLRYEHIARAAIGSALACSLKGSDGDAIRWLDAIGDSEEVPDTVREQLVVRRIGVLGEAKRWADLEFFLRKVRHADRAGGGPEVKPLGTVPARLLAVIVLEADKRIAGDQIEGLAKIALGDLVARNEVRQVLDLVRRYGTAPIGDSGFIVNYVRGLLQYDQARAAHKRLDPAAEEPTTDAATRNLYIAAGAMLEAALHQTDAETFRSERAEAALALGRSEFFAGNTSVAGERFAMAFEMSGGAAGGAGAEEALWLAVLAMDKSARAGGLGAGRSEQRRTELATLFLRSFPVSARAARVVLMQAAAGELGEDESLRILTEVPRDSPVYEQSRRQAARLLYNKVRGSKGAERDFAALRFIGISEELLALDRKAALGAEPVTAREAGERLVVRVRQMLDALLGGASPDASRAQGVLDVLDGVVAYNKLDLAEHEPELTFRRFQIAVARDKEKDAADLAEKLAAGGPKAGVFAGAADRVVYKRAAARWRKLSATGAAADPAQLDAAARQVVRIGRRVITRLGEDTAALADPAVGALYSTVAGAASGLAKGEDEKRMRAAAIALDKAILKSQPRLEEALRRLATNLEATGDAKGAVECWRTILGAARQGSEPWFEGRYQVIRLLALNDKPKARELMDQQMLLYPDFGPAPWTERFRELSRLLATPSASPARGGKP